MALLALMAALLAAMVVLAGKPAHAATTFTVNNVEDPGSGTCDGAGCTLREAITAANSVPGADTIRFNIPGTGVHTIKPTSALPVITDTVTIDGYTQAGANENTNPTGAINATPRIELEGIFAGQFENGLEIEAAEAPGSVIKGLVINRFDRGIVVDTGDCDNVAPVKLEGNFVGTDPTGTFDEGNNGTGVLTSCPTVVGGSTPEARNLISGNDAGVSLKISGSTVKGNLIGTAKDGKSDLGNDLMGVDVGGLPKLVGGTTPEDANTIAFNGLDGVSVSGSLTGHDIMGNSIFSNAGLGIDLVGQGESLLTNIATPNDPKDVDQGPNGLQNKPNLTSATKSGGATTIKGKLNSTPKETFKIQFFKNPSGDEGKTFIGQKSVSTDASGKVSFTFKPASKVPVGQKVTATATGVEGTSEFSTPRAVVN